MKLNGIIPRLLLAFLLLSPLPLGGIAWFYSYVFEKALMHSVESNLAAIADKKYDQINIYIDERIANGEWLARTAKVKELLPLFSDLWAQSGTSSPSFQQQLDLQRQYYRTAYVSMGYYDLMFIDMAGNVVFSIKQEADLGSNLNSDSYHDSALARGYRDALVMLAGQVVVERAYAPSGDKPAIFVVTPVVNNGRPIGALALQLDALKLSAVTADRVGLGQTGEAVLAQPSGKGAFFAGPLRHIPNAAFRYQVPATSQLSKPMQFALQGQRGQGVASDYAGVEVVAAWRYLPALNWGMVVKVDAEEAFAPVRLLRTQMGGILILFMLIAVATALAVGRSLINPLRNLIEATGRIANGDLGQRVAIRGWKELRELALSFNTMADHVNADQDTLEWRIDERTRQLQQQKTLYDVLVASISAGVYTFRIRSDGGMGFEYVSPRFCELTDLTQEAIRRDPMLPFEQVHPDDRDEMVKRNQEAARTLEPFRMDCRFIIRGDIRWFHIESEPTPTDDGGSLWNGVLIDVTERKYAEESLQLAAQLYQHSSEGMSVTDADGTILSVNPAFTAIAGYKPEEAIGKTHGLLSSGRQDQSFYSAMWNAINSTGQWQGELWNRRKNGELYVVELSINTVFREDGKPWRRVGLFSDITQRKASEDLIWHQANFDLLTGLPNRRLFYDRLSGCIKESKRTGLPLALLFVDIDHFKEINDTLGHEYGDLLIKEAANRLLSCVRETDTVARLGGDEFTVILGKLENPVVVERVAQSILGALAQPYSLQGESSYVSASIGITLCPDDAADLAPLIKNADQAMYAAKQQGRNRYCYFTSAMQNAAEQRQRLTKELRIALALQQLEVYYQPIVELSTGKVHKAEALLRWRHPLWGFVSPAEFIPIAEEAGLIHEIGDWVFHQATHQLGQWQALAGPGFQMSVNKSPLQFHDIAHLEDNHWIERLRSVGLAGNSLVVEITEGLLLDASAHVLDNLLRFRDAGVQVAIDDFGTGYSALSYLHKFDIDYLKIDQSFIRNLTPESSDLALCEAIVVMAHKLGLKVIAEGVETKEQLDLLLGVGCDYGQGFHFAKPMPAEEFEALLVGQVAPE